MRETALVVVVEEARTDVDPWRRRYAPDVVAGGLPPHITVLYPFAPADVVDEGLLAGLRTLYASCASFAFDLVGVEEFPDAVWLAPDPSDPFVSLCLKTWERYPELPPYGGSFGEPVPHLTIAARLGAATENVAAVVRAGISSALPIACHAAAVTLLEQKPDASWAVRERLPLRTS